jgi:hypothetical protein
MFRLCSIIYKSEALIGCGSEEEQSLMDYVLLANRRSAITGFLIRTNENYYQYLEGRETVVMDLLDRIRANSLHRNLKVLLKQRPKERCFPRWYMEYYFLTTLEKDQCFDDCSTDFELATSVLNLMQQKATRRGEVNYRSLK